MGRTNPIINDLVKKTTAKPISDPEPSDGYFHHLVTQDFKVMDFTFSREYIDSDDVVVILPITKTNKLLTIFQPVALSDEGSLIEFPAGHVDMGESIKDAAYRELLEETGYRAGSMYSLGKFYQSPGLLKNRIYPFVAFNCVKVQEQDLDPDEHMIPYEFDYSDFMELIDNFHIMDANTLITFYRAEYSGFLQDLY